MGPKQTKLLLIKGIKFMLLRKILICCLASVLLTFGSAIYAQHNGSNTLFNSKDASFQLNSIHFALNTKELKQSELKLFVNKLEVLHDKAQMCVAVASHRLDEVNQLLASVMLLGDQKTVLSSNQYQYLKNEKESYAKQVADCQMFVFRSQQDITATQERMQQLGIYNILKQSPPLWALPHQKVQFSLKNLNLTTMYDVSGIQYINAPQLGILFFLIAITVLLSFWIRAECSKWLRSKTPHSDVAVTTVTTLKAYITPVLILGATSVFLTAAFLLRAPNPTIELISYFALGYVIFLMLISFILLPHKHAQQSLSHITPKIGKAFLTRLSVLGALLLIFISIIAVFRGQNFNIEIIDIFRTIFYVLFSFNIVWICWLFTKMPHIEETRKTFVLTLRIALFGLLVMMITVQSLGYYRLAAHLIIGIFSAFAAIATFWLIVKVMNSIERLINYDDSALSKKIRHYLGLKQRHSMGEFVFIKIVVYLVAIAVLGLLLLRLWGVSLNNIDMLQNAIMNGFSIADLKIIPSQIITAFLAFGVLLIFRRIVATAVAHHYQFAGEKDTQVAVATIINYAMFGLALIVALIISGVSFTGLALIAGALSVGIGLGLQNIVNNFVSGIILLLEKPIKPGDRIIVDGIEGFVKKVRTRSTQILTLAKEDVIIPNADLIANKVTNFMFRDSLNRVECKVGVVYGSDVNLVEKVMLEVANKHPDVINDEPNQPFVLFREFGNSSLDFTLYAIIHDVNKRYFVVSDLNFAIHQIFKKHKIVIAFPQLDVHVKDGIAPKKLKK